MPALSQSELCELIVSTSNLSVYMVEKMVERALMAGLELDDILRAHNLGGPDCIIGSTYVANIEGVMELLPYAIIPMIEWGS